MQLDRPICFFDLEGTGLDVAKDKIISIAITKISPGVDRNETSTVAQRINPTIPIPPESTAIHGITDDMVKDLPDFTFFAEGLHAFLKDCDLGGYNLRNYDIPLLWEELYRCGIQWDLSKAHVVDVGAIFKKKEERTLTAAVKFYCGREMEDAHNALADTKATIDVLGGQMKRYVDIADMTVAQLSEFSKFDNRVDLAGKLVYDQDGDPVYNIGKSKGVKVKDDPSFAQWMLARDFSQQTKNVLCKLLDEMANQGQDDMFK